MYFCFKCRECKNTLHEAVYHLNNCNNKWNRMVYSNHRVAPHNQYRRHRNIKKFNNIRSPLEKFLIVTKLL